MSSRSPWCRGIDCNCQGRNTQTTLQKARSFEGKRMMKEKYNKLRTPARISPHMASKLEKKWISDGYIDNVVTLQKQDGFSLQMVEYHYGNMSHPYLMHDCNPEEDLIEQAWYCTAESTDNNHCIYCMKPYPTEILTAAKLLNASLAYQFKP